MLLWILLTIFSSITLVIGDDFHPTPPMGSMTSLVEHNNAQVTEYAGSLAPADFGGAVFTCAYFQKLAQISSLCNFHYINEGIPSLMRFGLLMT